jgi:hypothetical protein
MAGQGIAGHRKGMTGQWRAVQGIEWKGRTGQCMRVTYAPI